MAIRMPEQVILYFEILSSGMVARSFFYISQLEAIFV